MPNIVFGNSSSSHHNGTKIETILFVQNLYLRFNHVEGNVEEDIDLKKRYRIKNLHAAFSIREAPSKNYVEDKFNDPSIIASSAYIILNDENTTNTRFLQVNQLPQIFSQSTAKLYVDTSIDETSLVTNIKENDFIIYILTNKNSMTLNTQAFNDNYVVTKSYVDQFHRENEGPRQDLGLDKIVLMTNRLIC